MSFSFTVQAASKAEVEQRVDERFAAIIQGQPVHAADEPALKALTKAYLALLPDNTPDDQKEYKLDLSGSLSWEHVPGETPKAFTMANVQCTVAFVRRL